MPPGKEVRKLAAIIHADVKGYSRLMGEDESYTVAALKECRKVFAENVRNHDGRVVNAPGDSILAEFPSVVSAVQCAVEIQELLKGRNADLPDNRKMVFRIGVNLGDVIESEDAIYGDGVNIAARIEALAKPGDVSISRTVFNHVRNKLPYGYKYQGEHQVKNIADPVRVYKVLTAPEETGKLLGEEPKANSSRWIWPTAVVAAVIVALIGYHLYQKIGRPEFEPASVEKMAYPLPETPSIVVLPFVNMSGDPDQEFLSDGLTEEIITSLSQTQELFVIARNSSFTYKGKPANVKQVAEELGVRYVLEGSVRKSEDRVRITAQLLDAVKGTHLWAERYDRYLRDLFEIQDEITLKILTALRIKLTDGEDARIWEKKGWPIEVQLKALEAISLFNKLTKETFIRYGQISQEIVEMAPEHSIGYRLLAWYNLVLAGGAGGLISPKAPVDRALKYAQKAYSIDDSDPFVLHTLGYVYLMKREYEKAIDLMERAVDIAPNAALPHSVFGRILCYAGNPDKGISHLNQSLRLDPFPPSLYYMSLGLCYLMKRQYEKSLEEYKKASHLSPDSEAIRVGIISGYSLLGRDADARREAEKLLELNPVWDVALINLLPFKNQEDANLLIGALLKAGLPDNRKTVLQDSLPKK